MFARGRGLAVVVGHGDDSPVASRRKALGGPNGVGRIVRGAGGDDRAVLQILKRLQGLAQGTLCLLERLHDTFTDVLGDAGGCLAEFPEGTAELLCVHGKLVRTDDEQSDDEDDDEFHRADFHSADASFTLLYITCI